MKNYDSFTIGDYGILPEDIAPFENIEASNQPQEQARISSSGSTLASTFAITGAKRSRSSTSGVWDDFDKTTKPNAQGVQVRYAICKICKLKLSAKFPSGTTCFLRRVVRYNARQGLAMRQT